MLQASGALAKAGLAAPLAENIASTVLFPGCFWGLRGDAGDAVFV